MDDDGQIEEITFDEALAEFQPFIGRTYAAIVVDKISGAFIIQAWGKLTSIQGDLDFAMILLGTEEGPRIDLKRELILKVEAARGSGSVLYHLAGVRLVLSLQP